jgi:hypothetical protein
MHFGFGSPFFGRAFRQEEQGAISIPSEAISRASCFRSSDFEEDIVESE